MPLVKGCVDGLEGRYVVGWACASENSNCEITIACETTKVLARGFACLERPDLARLALGRCNIGFRVLVPDYKGTSWLHVSADGIELMHSPLALGPTIFDGGASFARGYVEGWTTRRAASSDPPLISIVDQNGRTVAEGLSQVYDLEPDPNYSPARFASELPDFCFGARDSKLDVMADGVLFAEVICDLTLYGHVEVLTPTRVSGWLVAPNAAQRAFAFQVFRDGILVAKANSTISRLDVTAKFAGCQTPGFDVELPPPAQGWAGQLSLSMRFSGSDRELFDGPYQIASRGAVIKAARALAGLSKGRLPQSTSEFEVRLLQEAVKNLIERARSVDQVILSRQLTRFEDTKELTGLDIIVPVYTGVAITRVCIESILAVRSEVKGRVIIINDQSPEPDMLEMLANFARIPTVMVITNERNLGFVKSVNRGLGFAGASSHVLLLNSDTRIFAGGLSELWRVAHSSSDIGTVTAISNNATIFSYPNATERQENLDDIDWKSLAAVALSCNQGKIVDVPTGHGFCMLIKREVLTLVGTLDESFGRGYGEENDFCIRTADIGYRNVAALGAFVEHRESISFKSEKSALLAKNLSLLESRYPEYATMIIEIERDDPFRRGRWGLDAARLGRASKAGRQYTLLICNTLAGGTERAVHDLEEFVGYGNTTKLVLSCRVDGTMILTTKTPSVVCLFGEGEANELFHVLSFANIKLVIVHQILGFSADFLHELTRWIKRKPSVFYAHDFYPLCPRVTLINAANEFCNLPPLAVCDRCVSIGGSHVNSQLKQVTPEMHRRLFSNLLASFDNIITPSASASSFYGRVFSEIEAEPLPHPSSPYLRCNALRIDNSPQILLLGAIGPHKGSSKLVEIASLARLHFPLIRFNVIGHTDRDDTLLKLGNVSISGPYDKRELPNLIKKSSGRLALFLHNWPETFSYAFSETVHYGFFPLVPDIGAPADRVRESGFGAIFSFPIIASEVLELISKMVGDNVLVSSSCLEKVSRHGSDSVSRTRAIYRLDKNSGKA